MTRRDDTASGVEACDAAVPGRGPNLTELTEYVDRVTHALSEPQQVDLAAALRRVWLRNRLPDSVPTAAVRDVADHRDLATIAALAFLAAEASARVDPVPVIVWNEPAAQQESPVAGWGLS
jgi:hypothetical protein